MEGTKQNTYLLSNTPTTMHLVTIGDRAHAVVTQEYHFALGPDDIEMLTAVLNDTKENDSVPHRFTNVNANYSFRYEPGPRPFSIRQTVSERVIAMTLPTAYRLLDAIQGNTKELIRQGKGGPALTKSTRRGVLVRIEELNDPPSSLFDTNVVYSSSELPGWFQPLQAIFEDTSFTEMWIKLDSHVQYHISLVEESK